MPQLKPKRLNLTQIPLKLTVCGVAVLILILLTYILSIALLPYPYGVEGETILRHVIKSIHL